MLEEGLEPGSVLRAGLFLLPHGAFLRTERPNSPLSVHSNLMPPFPWAFAQAVLLAGDVLSPLPSLRLANSTNPSQSEGPFLMDALPVSPPTEFSASSKSSPNALYFPWDHRQAVNSKRTGTITALLTAWHRKGSQHILV